MTHTGSLPKGLRILIVEDESLIADEIAHRLSRRGVTVFGPADTADAAIRMAVESRPDLILMDIRLKGSVDGIDAANTIHQQLDVPVVFLTANADEATFRRAQTPAEYGYVLKPFHERDLFMAIELALHRHRIDLEMRRSHLTHAAISHHMAEMVVVVDSLRRVRYLNPAATRLIGWTLEEAAGRVIDEVVPLVEERSGAPYRAPATEFADASSASVRTAALLRLRSGERVPVEVSSSAIVSYRDDSVGMVLTLHDMRASRLAQRALLEREERFRSAFDLAGIGMALVDQHGTFFRVNSSLCRMLGCANAAMLGQPDTVILHSDSIDAYRHAALRVRTGEDRAANVELRLRHHDGHYLWTAMTLACVPDAEGGTQHLIMQLQDIDQRVRLVADLRERSARHERFEAALSVLARDQLLAAADAAGAEARLCDVVSHALDSAHVSLWRLSDDDHQLRCDAIGGNRLTGTTGQSLDVTLTTTRAAAVLSPAQWEALLQERIVERLQTLGIGDVVCEWIREEGQVRGAVVCAPPAGVSYDTDHWWTHDMRNFIAAVSHLVTARHAQTSAQRAQERLRDSEKMAAVGQLAGGIAHDFNNLLTVIQGCSDLLLENLPADAMSDRELATSIHDAGARAVLLTRQLLHFARTTPAVAGYLQPNEAVYDLIPVFQRLVGEHIALATQCESDLPGVRINATHLEQVLLNLVVNARDAMREGGTITISTSLATADGARHAAGVAPVTDRRHVVIEVRDTGTGIPSADLRRIFEPFYTTKPLGEGTGLGLATAYALVTSAKGFLTVESTEGEGAVFRVWLPEAVIEASSVASEPATSVSNRTTATILVVEDELAIRRVAARILTARGYEVLEAGSAHEAIARLEQVKGQVDLLITDVVMPGLTGGQLATQVRALWPSLPIVFMSGYHNDAIVLAGVRATNSLFLDKPFTAKSLERVVLEALEAATTSAPRDAGLASVT